MMGAPAPVCQFWFMFTFASILIVTLFPHFAICCWCCCCFIDVVFFSVEMRNDRAQYVYFAYISPCLSFDHLHSVTTNRFFFSISISCSGAFLPHFIAVQSVCKASCLHFSLTISMEIVLARIFHYHTIAIAQYNPRSLARSLAIAIK